MTQGHRRYIPTLDGWRAVAIILVVFCHDQVHRLGPISTSWLTDHGDTGVDVFFAISGILICTLLLDEEEQTGKISLQQFYVRRAFRILPASVVYLLVLEFLRMYGLIAVPTIDWLGSLFFFRNYLPQNPTAWYTNHFWSLSVEEHFYFFLPGFLVLYTRFRARTLFLVGAATLVAFAIAKRSHYPAGWPPLDFTDFRLSALLIAAATAVSLRRNRIRQLATKVLHPLPIIVLAAAVVTLNKFVTILLPFFMVAMVSSTVLRPGSIIAAGLESRPLRFVGKRSYSLYLWQQLFMTARFRYGIIDFYFQKWPFSVLFAFVCACLSYSLIEQPLIRLGRRALRYYATLRDSKLLAENSSS